MVSIRIYSNCVVFLKVEVFKSLRNGKIGTYDLILVDRFSDVDDSLQRRIHER